MRKLAANMSCVEGKREAGVGGSHQPVGEVLRRGDGRSISQAGGLAGKMIELEHDSSLQPVERNGT